MGDFQLWKKSGVYQDDRSFPEQDFQQHIFRLSPPLLKATLVDEILRLESLNHGMYT